MVPSVPVVPKVPILEDFDVSYLYKFLQLEFKRRGDE